ncbi:MAG TPA: DUF5522 domain-containing protein [Acidimicrobiales bacterium]|nr:DUF5522 domain-containing protein [Acidimicrobiales bacterium]
MKAGPSGPKRDGWLDQPDPSRLDPGHPRRDEILARHARAVAAGLSTYLDPGTGYSVLTAAYLAERGYCCSQGCRHCPWEGAEPEA